MMLTGGGRAVVDHAGKLVANISVSDLQYVVERDLDNLFTTVEHFLQRVPRRPLVTCSPTATLVSLLPPSISCVRVRAHCLT
jgi:CBS domain-containing protein